MLYNFLFHVFYPINLDNFYIFMLYILLQLFDSSNLDKFSILPVSNIYNLMNVLQGTFLPLVVPPTIYHAGLWSIWLTVLCCLKVWI